MEPIPDDELLSAYLDDELSADDRAQVERQLAVRPEVRRLYDELRGVRESLQALPSYRLTDDFGASVLRRAEREMLREPTLPEVAARSLPPGDAPADASRPRSTWTQRFTWSIVAVAAALTIMFFERGMVVDKAEREPEVNRDFALNTKKDAPKPSSPPAAAEMRAAAPVAQPAPPAAQVPVPAKARSVAVSETDADRRSAGPVMSKSADAAAATTAPMPTVPPANNFAVMNGGAVSKNALNTPSNGGSFAVENTYLPPTQTPSQTVAPMMSAPLVQSAPVVQSAPSTAAAVAGTSILSNVGPTSQLPQLDTSSASQLGTTHIDTTPLMVASDYQRACQLINELGQSAQKGDGKPAVESQGLRFQNVDDLTRVQAGRTYPDAEPLVIVRCQATPDGVNEGLTPVLVGNRIADLTSLQSDAGANSSLAWTEGNLGVDKPSLDKQLVLEKNAAANKRAFAPASPLIRRVEEAVAGEESHDVYLYIVADKKQIESTVDALRTQSQYFSDFHVEAADEVAPPPADVLTPKTQTAAADGRQQQRWGLVPQSRAQRLVQRDFNATPPAIAPALPTSAGLGGVAPTPKPAERSARKEAEREVEAAAVGVPAAAAKDAVAAGRDPAEHAIKLGDAEAKQFGEVAEGRRPDLPPDFQEALIIFRVAGAKSQDAASAPAATPPAAASPGSAPPAKPESPAKKSE